MLSATILWGHSPVPVMLAMRLLIVESLVRTLSTVEWTTTAMLRQPAQMAQGASFVLVMLAMKLLTVESLVQTLSTVGWMITVMLRQPAQMAQGASLVIAMLDMKLLTVASCVLTRTSVYCRHTTVTPKQHAWTRLAASRAHAMLDS
jgi:hypothetical protein